MGSWLFGKRFEDLCTVDQTSAAISQAGPPAGPHLLPTGSVFSFASGWGANIHVFRSHLGPSICDRQRFHWVPEGSLAGICLCDEMGLILVCGLIWVKPAL